MKKNIITIICVMLLVSLPLWAVEELMTKLYFDNWLRTTTAPLEQQMAGIKATYDRMERTLQEIKNQLGVEIVTTIGNKTAYIDGQPVALDAPPIIINGRTMVPLRFIGEALGAQFDWDKVTKKVTCIYGNLTMELYVNQKLAKVGNTAVTLDAAPVIQEGRTLVPLRFIGEQLGAEFAWNATTKTVTIKQ